MAHAWLHRQGSNSGYVEEDKGTHHKHMITTRQYSQKRKRNIIEPPPSTQGEEPPQSTLQQQQLEEDPQQPPQLEEDPQQPPQLDFNPELCSPEMVKSCMNIIAIAYKDKIYFEKTLCEEYEMQQGMKVKLFIYTEDDDGYLHTPVKETKKVEPIIYVIHTNVQLKEIEENIFTIENRGDIIARYRSYCERWLNN